MQAEPLPERKTLDEEITWAGVPDLVFPPVPWWAKLRGGVRGVLFVLLTLTMLPIYLLVRHLGRRADRLWVQLWCRGVLLIAGVRLRRIGQPLVHGGALVANHISWMDIPLLGAAAPVHFVAKADVAVWPGIGVLARLARTEFIERRRTDSANQSRSLFNRIAAGDLLAIFPEGTTTDGLRVIPFRSSLFSIFYGADPPLWVQPVTLHYAPPAHLPEAMFGWWGGMSLGQSIWTVMCLSRGSVATVAFHAPMHPESVGNRKALAAAATAAVADGLHRAASGQRERMSR